MLAWTTGSLDRHRMSDRLRDLRARPWVDVAGDGARLRLAAASAALARMAALTEDLTSEPAADVTVVAGGAFATAPPAAIALAVADTHPPTGCVPAHLGPRPAPRADRHDRGSGRATGPPPRPRPRRAGAARQRGRHGRPGGSPARALAGIDRAPRASSSATGASSTTRDLAAGELAFVELRPGVAGRGALRVLGSRPFRASNPARDRPGDRRPRRPDRGPARRAAALARTGVTAAGPCSPAGAPRPGPGKGRDVGEGPGEDVADPATADLALVRVRRLVVAPIMATFRLGPGERRARRAGEAVVRGAPLAERLRDARTDVVEGPAAAEPGSWYVAPPGRRRARSTRTAANSSFGAAGDGASVPANRPNPSRRRSAASSGRWLPGSFLTVEIAGAGAARGRRARRAQRRPAAPDRRPRRPGARLGDRRRRGRDDPGRRVVDRRGGNHEGAGPRRAGDRRRRARGQGAPRGHGLGAAGSGRRPRPAAVRRPGSRWGHRAADRVADHGHPRRARGTDGRDRRRPGLPASSTIRTSNSRRRRPISSASRPARSPAPRAPGRAWPGRTASPAAWSSRRAVSRLGGRSSVAIPLGDLERFA